MNALNARPKPATARLPATDAENRAHKRQLDMLADDCKRICTTDLSHPFKNLQDAVDRLLPYHVRTELLPRVLPRVHAPPIFLVCNVIVFLPVLFAAPNVTSRYVCRSWGASQGRMLMLKRQRKPLAPHCCAAGARPGRT